MEGGSTFQEGSIIQEDDASMINIKAKGPSKNNRLNVKLLSVIKMNLIRNIPKKLGCSRFLKEDEKLFIHGLKQYRERIKIANFLSNFKKISKNADGVR